MARCAECKAKGLLSDYDTGKGSVLVGVMCGKCGTFYGMCEICHKLEPGIDDIQKRCGCRVLIEEIYKDGKG